jgi:hypothetical protein
VNNNKYLRLSIPREFTELDYFMILGFFGSVRSFGGFQSPEQCVLQPQDEEIVALRHQFEAAKQSFLKIPHTLKEMPKMNPKG